MTYDTAFLIVPIIIGGALGVTAFIACMRRDDGSSCKAYLDWVNEIRENTPDFQPPYVTNAQGRWIPNPDKPAHQTIKHRDGTIKHL